MIIEKEELAVSVTLSGTYWNQAPQYEIFVDEDLVASGQIPTTSSRRGLPDETMTAAEKLSSLYQIEFSVSLEPGEHVIKVRLPHKSKKDTLLNSDGTVRKDLLLNIENITIDGVDLGALVYKESRYDFDHEQLHHNQLCSSTTNCTSMGYVGTWSIPITSPFYLWLLERL